MGRKDYRSVAQHSSPHRPLVGRKTLFHVSPVLLSELCRPWMLPEPKLLGRYLEKTRRLYALRQGATSNMDHCVVYKPRSV